jgi:hypothetical protein
MLMLVDGCMGYIKILVVQLDTHKGVEIKIAALGERNLPCSLT